MKLGADMHLPKEDDSALSGGSFFDIDLDSLFGNPSSDKTDNTNVSHKNKLELCPECLQRGEQSFLAPFQLNFEEAIYMCPMQSCSYPMKENNLVDSFVFKRDVSALPVDTAESKATRKSSGYSAFFEDFNLDAEFPDFLFTTDDQLTASPQSLPLTAGDSSTPTIIKDETVKSEGPDIPMISRDETVKSDGPDVPSMSTHETVRNEGSDNTIPLTSRDETVINEGQDTTTISIDETARNEGQDIPMISEDKTVQNEEPDILAISKDETVKNEGLPASLLIDQDTARKSSEDDPKTPSGKIRLGMEGMQLADASHTKSSDCKTGSKISDTAIEIPSVIDPINVDESRPSTIQDYDMGSPMEVERDPEPFSSSKVIADDHVQSTSKVQIENDDAAFMTALEEHLQCPPTFSKMLQWVNRDNSCWLDSIMQVLVSSVNARAVLNVFKAGKESCLKRLMVTYDQCQRKFQEHNPDHKLGDGAVVECLSQKMGEIRSRLLSTITQFSPVKSKEFQSVLEMFPVVLKSDPSAENLFKVNLLWDFQCRNCGHQRARRSQSNVVSVPHTLPGFHPLNTQFQRHCYECKAPDGITTIHMEKLPPCLVFHFREGLPHSNLQVLDFAVQGHLYLVFAVVQYILSPIKHFVTWVRDKKTNKWRCCNDLEDMVCSWQAGKPKIPPNEIHMVFWERQLLKAPGDAQLDDVTTVLNEEVSTLSDEIPLEHFFAHEEDETIIIPEEDSNFSHCDPVGHQLAAHASVKAKTVVHPTLQDTSVPYQASPQVQNKTFHFSPSMFQHGGMTILPNGETKQMIQVVAPANTCSIFIVTNDNKNQQPVYIGPPPNGSHPPASPVTPCSFIDNPHCYKMVSQGIHGSVSSMGKTNLMSTNRPKRQYRLAGYTKPTSGHKFSPMKGSTKPYHRTRSTRSSIDGRSENSYNSKKDSETLSEASELSDRLPDFEFETSGSRRSSAANSSNSLPTSHSTTPTNGVV